MLNVMVALKIWGPLWENNNISIKCDNLPVVEVLTTGRVRDQIWQHVPEMSGFSLRFTIYT